MIKFWKKSFYVVLLLSVCFLTAMPLKAEAASLVTTSQGEAIAKTALSYAGNVEYKYGGYSSASQGLDNKGFVKYVLAKHGINVSYSMSSLAAAGSKVTSLKAGDVVFFSNRSGSSLSAVGIYVGNGYFVGSSSYFGGVVKKKLSAYASVYYGARRMSTTGESSNNITTPTTPSQSSKYGSSIVDKAKRYLGVPYVFGSSATSSSSFDCSSFVQRSVYDAGLGKLPRTARSQASYLASSSNAKTITSKSQLQPGDLIYFKNMGSHVAAGTVSHVAIYIGNNKIIQAMPNKGVIISYMTSYYTDSSKFAGAYRLVKPIK
ncbi:C40 family peptidase [Clostridium sp. 'deep sea']|uniref:C40 family peptidase n=1 Tax=Clostridium sp. 'deep sea' TaxID=2779445 RepID=UPI0018965D96|nr:NlpC/P60 family protein [Clostridium sp. 'deep sea']QOR36593.1 C40 family peptidase [Clostridium sp. 'deep sea']